MAIRKSSQLTSQIRRIAHHIDLLLCRVGADLSPIHAAGIAAHHIAILMKRQRIGA